MVMANNKISLHDGIERYRDRSPLIFIFLWVFKHFLTPLKTK